MNDQQKVGMLRVGIDVIDTLRFWNAINDEESKTIMKILAEAISRADVR